MSPVAVRLPQRSRRIHLFQLLLAAVIIVAPLACALFCQAVHVANAPAGLQAAAHAASHAGHNGSGSGEDSAPLTDMQQLMHAVTDSLPAADAWVSAWAMIGALAALVWAPVTRVALSPPTPPPRASR